MRWGLTNQVVGGARPHSWKATEKQVWAVVASVAMNCAAKFDEDMCWAIVNRGAMASLLKDFMTTEAAKAVRSLVGAAGGAKEDRRGYRGHPNDRDAGGPACPEAHADRRDGRRQRSKIDAV